MKNTKAVLEDTRNKKYIYLNEHLYFIALQKEKKKKRKTVLHFFLLKDSNILLSQFKDQNFLILVL